jgi:hypothetical protein
VRFCRIGWDRIAYFVGDLVDWVIWERQVWSLAAPPTCMFLQADFCTFYLFVSCI